MGRYHYYSHIKSNDSASAAAVIRYGLLDMHLVSGIYFQNHRYCLRGFKKYLKSFQKIVTIYQLENVLVAWEPKKKATVLAY